MLRKSNKTLSKQTFIENFNTNLFNTLCEKFLIHKIHTLKRCSSIPIWKQTHAVISVYTQVDRGTNSELFSFFFLFFFC